MPNEYLIKRQTLTELADEVRILSGKTEDMNLSEITTDIHDANEDVANQVELLEQITIALEGKAAGGGIDTSDATAVASDILSGKTAYAKGSKVTGTFTIDSELSTQDNLISQIQTALQNKASASEPVLQEKTATPTTATQSVTPDSGYDGLSKVTVNAIPTATQATPSISVNSSGLITASATQTAGYVAAGTKSATKQLTTQAAKTITPSTSSQTAVSSGVYTTGAVTVAAIPSTYVKPSTTKAATTYTPSTSNQTIAAGTYCSGAQTIKGDSNLKAENIAEGVSIFGVTGTHSGGSGGSGGGATCEISFSVSGGTCYYIDGNTMEKKFTSTNRRTITVPVNSIVAMTGFDVMHEASGLCSILFYHQRYAAYYISGNCSFSFSDEPA